MMRWLLIVLFPVVQSYLFGCYYDYSQPLVLPEQLPIGVCTHVLLIGAINVKNLNVNIIQRPYNGLNALQSMRDYRTRDSNKLKIIPSLVGDDDEWKTAMKDSESRSKFITSLIDFAKSQDLDGLDFDWEYPCGAYKSLFSQFIEELRLGVRKIFGNEFLLTTAVGAGKNTIDDCYEIGRLGESLDLIHLMTYDYHSIYDKQTGYSSPLYPKSIETDEARQYNTEWSAAYLVEQGVPRNKILIGLEGLGHTFQLNDSNIHDFAAPVVGIGYGGGWMTFIEYCLLVKTAGSNWDDEAKVNYTFYNDQWTNVGDVRAAAEKALFVKANSYGGAFTFGLHLDDPTDLCHHGETFPIHKTVARQLDLL
ncbi:unnamed protein product [Rotaria socialis]|uniref:GH18 domain-containing protein n=3 Tax=Rotaria socialis TaxID=392032 RepID=A0A818FPV0_9BILA|nr:unnamed protein product [Rotaria socialis]CAF4280496.1 unnamed protein product [Rotaria socialis]CAF4501351.1 unnamed protein product [Rotaria socialis]